MCECNTQQQAIGDRHQKWLKGTQRLVQVFEGTNACVISSDLEPFPWFFSV